MVPNAETAPLIPEGSHPVHPSAARASVRASAAGMAFGGLGENVHAGTLAGHDLPSMRHLFLETTSSNLQLREFSMKDGGLFPLTHAFPKARTVTIAA